MNPENAKLLLIEDNRDDVFAFNWALKKTNLDVRVNVVTDGKMAVDYLSGIEPYSDREAHPLPDLIFLDLKLPYLGGLEVLAWIREQPHLRGVRVVILSGSDEPRDRASACCLGSEGYLVKPATPSDLTEIVLEVLGRERFFVT